MFPVHLQPLYAYSGLCLRAYLSELQSNNTPESLPENTPAHLGCALGPVHEYHRHFLNLSAQFPAGVFHLNLQQQDVPRQDNRWYLLHNGSGPDVPDEGMVYLLLDVSSFFVVHISIPFLLDGRYPFP